MIKVDSMPFIGCKFEARGSKDDFEDEFKAIVNSFIKRGTFTKEELIQFTKDAEDIFSVDGNDKDAVKQMFRESLDEIVSAIFDDSEEK